MDCRKTLGLGLCFLIGAAGCMRHEAALPVVPPPQASHFPAPAPVDAVPPGAVVKKASDLPKRPPQAATCVAFGDFAAREAESPDLTDTARRAKQDQARKAYEQAVSIDPKCLPAYLSLTQLYVAMKDHAHAEATCRKACQLFPNDARAFFEMGRCYGGEKQWEQAVPALTRAVQLDPENRTYVDTLGWMQARAGRFDDSLTTFRQVYDEPEAHYRLALMLEHLNQTDLCRSHLLAAISKDPQMERAKTLLSQLDAHPADPVQQASFTESAKPTTPPVAPAPAPAAAPAAAPAGKSVMLPPPPRIPIRYAGAPAPVAPPTLPPLPGPAGGMDNTASATGVSQ